MTKITLDVSPLFIDKLIASGLRESHQSCLDSIKRIVSDEEYRTKPYKVKDLQENRMVADAMKICCEYYGVKIEE